MREDVGSFLPTSTNYIKIVGSLRGNKDKGKEHKNLEKKKFFSFLALKILQNVKNQMLLTAGFYNDYSCRYNNFYLATAVLYIKMKH